MNHTNIVSDNFHQRIKCLDNEYQKDKQDLIERATLSQLSVEGKQAELEEYYKTILFATEEKFQETLATTQSDYIMKRDEEAKKVNSLKYCFI